MLTYLYFFFYDDDLKTWSRRYVTKAFVKNNPKVVILGLRWPITLGTFLTNPKRFIRFLFSPLEKIEDRIFAFTMVSFFPIKIMDRYKIIGFLFGWFLSVQLFIILRILGSRNISVWVTSITRAPFYLHLSKFPIVYDCHDDGVYFDSKPLELQIRIENEILNKAEVFFAVSKLVYEQKRGKVKRSYYIPQGVASHFFQGLNPLPQQLKDEFLNIKKPIVGYVGNVRDWLDFELLFKMVKQFPAASFVFVGNVETNVAKQKEILGKMFNVHFLGRQDFEIVPEIIRAFDVALIPFKDNKFNRATAPYKFMEYMALGKPVLSLNIFELRSYADVVYLYDTHEEALIKLNSLLTNKDNAGLSSQRIKLARELSIDKVAERYHKALKECLLEN